ncbi:MAG: chromosome segregation protein [Bacteroidetes bacterium ADurb.BinA104]|nr:MAG: chromosome segregation protein [Bacteroidetes bacterium ADurb.BinA104]
MKILITRLVLHNFKGAKHLEVPLNPEMNAITGRNATCKTTIFDAFAWALFGKDSEDRTDFNVKTLNADGEPEHRLEHSVELTMKVDDQKITFKRVLEEKWTKPKGQKEAIFSGHETSYYVNEVPCSMKEYNLKVETICRPDVFKFITNPLYFPSMPWNKQREILTVIAGTMPEVQPSEALAELLGRITGKTLKEYKAEIKKKKDLAQAELDGIEPRIKENDLKKSAVLELGYDYPAIEKNISAIQHEISGVDQTISEVAKQKDAAGQKRMSIQQEINNLKIAQQRIETEVRIAANGAGETAKIEFERLTAQLKAKQTAKTDTEATIRSENANLTVIEKKITDLRAEWHTENDKRMNVSDDILACPTCGREFEESQVEEKKAALALKFNESKARRLAEIQTEGQALATRKDKITTLILSLTSDLSKIETEIFELTQQREAAEKALPQEVVSISPLLEAHEEYQKNLTEIARLEQSLTTITVPGVETYQAKRRELDADLSRLNAVLSTKNTITECDTRIEQLKSNQRKLAQVIADYERDENTIMDYTRTYVRIVEERVNSMFKIARFKMFNILINGSEEETCECMVDGVPFRDLNNGMKITAGFDIINTLSDYYHIYAPIFLDNAESLSVLPETRSQVIGLYVTEDTTLHINGKPTAKNAAPILETINA